MIITLSSNICIPKGKFKFFVTKFIQNVHIFRILIEISLKVKINGYTFA